jgi:hypothetical protein
MIGPQNGARQHPWENPINYRGNKTMGAISVRHPGWANTATIFKVPRASASPPWSPSPGRAGTVLSTPVSGWISRAKAAWG